MSAIATAATQLGVQDTLRAWLTAKKTSGLNQIYEEVRVSFRKGKAAYALRLLQLTAEVLGSDYSEWLKDFAQVKAGSGVQDSDLVKQDAAVDGWLAAHPPRTTTSSGRLGLGPMIFASALASGEATWASSRGPSSKFKRINLPELRRNDPMLAR
jgi:hypothetical protein